MLYRRGEHWTHIFKEDPGDASVVLEGCLQEPEDMAHQACALRIHHSHVGTRIASFQVSGQVSAPVCWTRCAILHAYNASLTTGPYVPTICCYLPIQASPQSCSADIYAWKASCYYFCLLRFNYLFSYMVLHYDTATQSILTGFTVGLTVEETSMAAYRGKSRYSADVGN